MSDWKYYNHALIPNCAPHEEPDVNQLKEEFKKNKKALFARWTTDWDCGYETDWWYVIKDEPFDIDRLKSNYRYKINKGKKNFEVKVIDPKSYIKELYEIQNVAWETYPLKYRPVITYDNFKESMLKSKDIIFGALYNNKLCGYAVIDNTNGINLVQQKVIPSYEKFQINAAIVDNILAYYDEELIKKDIYILDGSRSVFHETNFQDYLEKYFGFRKSYCRLHMKYIWYIKPIIYMLYPFKNLIKKSSNKILYRVYAILKMEEYSRKCKKMEKVNE